MSTPWFNSKSSVRQLTGLMLTCAIGLGCNSNPPDSPPDELSTSEQQLQVPGQPPAGSYADTYYSVRQGDFRTSVRALSGTQSATAFYAYGIGFESSANTGEEVSNQSTVFIYHDTTLDQFSLFIIHDKTNDGTGGAVELLVQGLDNASHVAQHDDAGEGIVSVLPVSQASAKWAWLECCTDGTAVTFSSREICVTITPQTMAGINAWSVVSEGPMSQRQRTQLPELMEPISICFNRPPIAEAGPAQVLECTGNGGATATLDGTASWDPDGDALTYNWLIDGTTHRQGAVVQQFLTLGSHNADLTVSDGFLSDTDRTTVTVVDTVPPVVTVTGPPEMWPPNHKLHTVSLEDCGISIQDVCRGNIDLDDCQASIVWVSSNEPVNATGDGNTEPDIIFVDKDTVQLRSERQGPSTGRIYKIHFSLTAPDGHTVNSTCVATVPHDQSGTPAYNNTEAYRVYYQP